LKPNEFQDDAPGRVVKSPLGHWTFVPNSLPPALEYTAELVKGLSEADRALGELAGAGRMLPNPHLLIRPFIRREAVLSSKIEGTITRLDELFLFEADPEGLSHPVDAAEVRNYVRALEHGLTAIRNGHPFTLQLLRELHRILLDDVRGNDKRPGQIRDRAVLIGKSFDFEAARFVPPCHTQLDPLLQDFIGFLRDHRSLPIVVQLALAHYQFETIHPFNDGNGRVGRLLITLMLCERKILPEPLLYLSAYFEHNRQEYYDALLDTSRKAAWNDWLLYFARGVTEQARDAIQRTRQLLELWQEYRQKSADASRSANALRLVDELFSSPYITVNVAAETMKIAFKSAAAIIQRFEEIGILREVTGQQRYRIYCADRIYQLLEQPLAPEAP
jgi:Fic family protein